MGFSAFQIRDGSDRANTSYVESLTLWPTASPGAAGKNDVNAKESGPESPKLWKRNASSREGATTTEEVAPEMTRPKLSTSNITVEQIRTAQDEMVALYMQASTTSSFHDLTLADLAKPGQGKKELHVCGGTVTTDQTSPRTPKTLATILSLEHHLETDEGKFLPVTAETKSRDPLKNDKRGAQLPKAVEKAAKKNLNSPSPSRFVSHHPTKCCMCTSYVYLFKTRCLVCGKLYCRDCVRKGMGQMTEGRKCTLCVGRCFNERYKNRIRKGFNLSRMIKKAEIKASLLQLFVTVKSTRATN
ncbi:hypothetical protein O6H91_Y031200 [Diphasiastrum complanatum]|nr:hypothetical protein O6H91_Y031200 [Diphasiastrum complanatum]